MSGIKVEVRYNEFSGLWEVHGKKITYWMFEEQARRRAEKIQKMLDEEARHVRK